MSASLEYVVQNPGSALNTLRKATSNLASAKDWPHAFNLNPSWTSVKDTPYEANKCFYKMVQAVLLVVYLFCWLAKGVQVQTLK